MGSVSRLVIGINRTMSVMTPDGSMHLNLSIAFQLFIEYDVSV